MLYQPSWIGYGKTLGEEGEQLFSYLSRLAPTTRNQSRAGAAAGCRLTIVADWLTLLLTAGACMHQLMLISIMMLLSSHAQIWFVLNAQAVTSCLLLVLMVCVLMSVHWGGCRFHRCADGSRHAHRQGEEQQTGSAAGQTARAVQREAGQGPSQAGSADGRVGQDTFQREASVCAVVEAAPAVSGEACVHCHYHAQ